MFSGAVISGNKNVDYWNDRYFVIVYVVALALLRLLLSVVPLVLPLSSDAIWVLFYWVHAVLTFVSFHASSGSPDDALWAQGKFNNRTFWEQMDNGEQWTFNRKFLIVVPIVLFLIVSQATDWQPLIVLFNLLGLVGLITPKLPMFHRRRVVLHF